MGNCPRPPSQNHHRVVRRTFFVLTVIVRTNLLMTPSGGRAHLARCTSTWRRAVTRRLRWNRGPGLRRTQRSKFVLEGLDLALQRGEVACATRHRLVRGRCLTAHLPARERADLFLQCVCKTGHESGRLLGLHPLNACRATDSIAERFECQAPGLALARREVGEYQKVWSADLCGQASRRSFWSWSLRIAPRIEVAIAA